MAKKKDERIVKQAYKEERKAKASQKKTTNSGKDVPYLQPNDEHFVSFKNQLATMGLMLRDIPGDGNCLFRALNDQLEGHSRNHLRLRHDTVRFMIEHRADFEPFVEDDVPFQTHVRQLSQPGTYGGHDALVAFARMQKANIVIHQLNSPLWQIEGGPLDSRQLHLSYHNGEHYSSVRRIGDTSESAANIRININANTTPGPSNNGKSINRSERSLSPCTALAVGGVHPRYGDDDVIDRISTCTGCKDLSMISEALVDCNGDEQEATDFIMSMMLATESEPSSTMEETNEGECEAAACATDASSNKGHSAVARSAKLKLPTKKPTNKQRKEQNRREKMNRAKDKPDIDQKSGLDHRNGDDTDSVMVEAAIGCLKI